MLFLLRREIHSIRYDTIAFALVAIYLVWYTSQSSQVTDRMLFIGRLFVSHPVR